MVRKSNERRESVLRIIVDDYISTAMPVASESVIRKYHIGVSSATIRNDMARLEEEGFITRPHTSAGSIPRDKGYRQYVESISDIIDLPEAEKRIIRRFFSEASDEIDRWLKLAAEVISHHVGNAVLISYPKARESKLMHVELLPLHDLMVLLIVVINEAVIKRKILSFGEELSAEYLLQMANKLNVIYAGLTQSEISDKKIKLGTHEQVAVKAIQGIITDHDEANSEEPYIEGLRLLLRQPEFSQKEKMLMLMDAIEENRRCIASKFCGQLNEGLQVQIGEECKDENFKDLSLVFSPYGAARNLRGSIGVIGPTRMDYHHVMATVHYVSEVLSDLLAGDFRDE